MLIKIPKIRWYTLRKTARQGYFAKLRKTDFNTGPRGPGKFTEGKRSKKAISISSYFPQRINMYKFFF